MTDTTARVQALREAAEELTDLAARTRNEDGRKAIWRAVDLLNAKAEAEPAVVAPADDDRRQQYAAVLYEFGANRTWADCYDRGPWLEYADAVMAVADAEQTRIRRCALRALDEIADLNNTLDRVRAVITERRTEVAEYEAENPPSAWSDAVTVTCDRVEDALREPAPSPSVVLTDLQQ